MMTNFIRFYNDILSKKRFWIPLLFFALVGYSFSIYNRTVGTDDFFLESHDVTYMLSGRWGMLVWFKLTGLMHASPFIDRFPVL